MQSLTRSRPETCLSDKVLDLWVGGELTDDRRGAAERHVAACDACMARLREIERGKAVFDRNAPDFSELARRARPARRIWPIATSALALAAALALVVRTPKEDERTKGGDRLGFYVMHEGSVRPGTRGEVVRPGDRLQLVVTNRKAAFVAVLSRDGAGRASIYFPKEPNVSALGPGVEKALPYALELDATLGEETLYGLFCDRAQSLEPLRRKLEQEGDKTEWPDGCHVDRVTYDKRP